jgi:hypothetical protein
VVAEAGSREGEAKTAFTPVLQALVTSVPGALGAVFTAGDGECVDYFSEMDPYDLKVIGAHSSLLLQVLGDSRLQPFERIGLCGRRLTLWIVPCGERYTLTLILLRRTWSADLEPALERAVRAIRTEASIS